MRVSEDFPVSMNLLRHYAVIQAGSVCNLTKKSDARGRLSLYYDGFFLRKM